MKIYFGFGKPRGVVKSTSIEADSLKPLWVLGYDLPDSFLRVLAQNWQNLYTHEVDLTI
jgi:hypothetical protein